MIMSELTYKAIKRRACPCKYFERANEITIFSCNGKGWDYDDKDTGTKITCPACNGSGIDEAAWKELVK